MYQHAVHSPDCKIFFRRLITPDPEIVASIPDGASHMDYITGDGAFGPQLPSGTVGIGAFRHYYPKGEFHKALIEKYRNKFKDLTTSNRTAIEELTKTRQDLLDTVNDIRNETIKDKKDTKEEASKDKRLKTAVDKLSVAERELASAKSSLKTVRPLYEAYLIELELGIFNVTTTIQRNGVGSASISIKLPLAENGFIENILTGIPAPEMFDDKPHSPFSEDNMRKALSIAGRDLSIFKLVRAKKSGDVLYTDRRECSLLPQDMIQIYFTKRYKGGEKKKLVEVPRFPIDYIPGFTGFIKSTDVVYSGGNSPNYTINIQCEDVANVMRITRANVDPALDPTYRADGLSVSMFTTKLQTYGKESKSGGELIKGLIKGRDKFWGGISQIESMDDMAFDYETQQYTSISQARGVKIISMPWEFDKIPLHTYDDLISAKIWSPYVASLKSSFRLWESEYKYRWDICKEIADVMEFELYADNFGAINYHPPLYNFNPMNPMYFIEDKDIYSENHKFSEANVVTGVEVTSQPKFDAIKNYAKGLSAYATASDELVQRYGIRFRTKIIPALSGTEDNLTENADQTTLRDARYLFARAWLNRRNLEVKSATVEIPGTPEYFLCNSIVFIGNFNSFIAGLARGIPKTDEEQYDPNVKGSSVLGKITKFFKGDKDVAKEVVDNLRVYYISAISHKYTQGSSFTTTLTLTHGRRWGEHYNVGYAFKEDESDELLQAFKKVALNRPKDDFTMLSEMFAKERLSAFLPSTGHVRPAMNSIEIPKKKLTANEIMADVKAQAIKIKRF